MLLDEPTTGLDPQARHHGRRSDRRRRQPGELISRYSTREVVELRFLPGADGTNDMADMETRLDGLADRTEVLPDRVLLYAANGEAVLAAVHRRGINPTSGLVRRSTLEDVFLRLTGRTLVD